MKDKEKFLKKLLELRKYDNLLLPLYNLIGSEGDYNTRVLVDNALEEIEKDFASQDNNGGED